VYSTMGPCLPGKGTASIPRLSISGRLKTKKMTVKIGLAGEGGVGASDSVHPFILVGNL